MKYLNVFYNKSLHLRSEAEKGLYQRGILDSEKLSLPNFLGIGAQKSGTTWLYHNLRSHPEIFLPEPKELHYFDRYYYKPVKTYAEKFVSGIGKTKGEITPAYSILTDKKIHFIKEIMPELKIILLLRRPVERAWSQALMNLVKLTDKRFQDIPQQEFLDHFKSDRSILRGDYKAIIKRWSDYFPRDQLYIGFFSDVKDNSKQLLKDTFNFLNVKEDVDWAQFPVKKKSNKGVDIKMPGKLRAFLEKMYKEDIKYYKQSFGEKVSHW